MKYMDKILLNPTYITGCVSVPSSKSVAHRALIAAALSNREVLIKNIDFSNDIYASIDSLIQLGVVIKNVDNGIKVDGRTLTRNKSVSLDVNESGSTLRFMIPIATVLEKEVVLNGKGRLPERPIDDYFDIFDKHNIKYSHPDGKYLPLSIEGKSGLSKVNVSGNTSSQFITGLIFCGMIEPIEINITTELQSKPYVDLTIDVLRNFGCVINESDNTYTVSKKDTLIDEYTVERDWSQAAFFMSAAAINGKITLNDMNMDSAQGDKEIISIIKRFGGKVEVEGNNITVEKSKLKGIDIDVGNIPDLVPTLAVLACYADGKTKIYNAERLKLKESNRLNAMYEELTSLGADIEIGDDYLIINGGKPLHGAEVKSHNDHRIAMAMAVASVGCEGEIQLKGYNAVNKSYPHFFEDWSRLYE